MGTFYNSGIGILELQNMTFGNWTFWGGYIHTPPFRMSESPIPE